MAITYEEVNEELSCIKLSGRLDFQGTEEVAGPFAALLAQTEQPVLVDLTAVTVICSMGIRTLILNASAFQRRGGRMALVVSDDTTVPRILRSVEPQGQNLKNLRDRPRFFLSKATTN